MAKELKKHLPGHIAAALAGAGGGSDSAGQSWAGRDLPQGQKYHNFDTDDGAAAQSYQRATEALAQGTGDEMQVIDSLRTVRVFIPIVAQVAEQTVGENELVSDKESDMALVTINAPDGRRALPVFTHVEALTNWHPEARPVAVYASRAALSAVAEEAQMLVLDPGTQRPFVVRRPAMWALAQQKEWLPSYVDPRVDAVLFASLRELSTPRIASISAEAGKGIQSVWDQETEPWGRLVCGGGTGPELAVTITLQPGLDQTELAKIVNKLQQHWSSNEYFAQVVDSVALRLRDEETAH